MTKFSIKILLILIVLNSVHNSLFSQDTFFLNELIYLPEDICYRNLPNIKQIKMIEHNKGSAYSDYVINFNRDKSINNIIVYIKILPEIETYFSFNIINKSCFEISRYDIYLKDNNDYTIDGEIIYKDSLKKKKRKEFDNYIRDTTYSLQKYFYYNDTLMTYDTMNYSFYNYDDTTYNGRCYIRTLYDSTLKTTYKSEFVRFKGLYLTYTAIDTTLIIYKDNKLFKRIEFRSSGRYIKYALNHVREKNTIYFYDEKKRISKIVTNNYNIKFLENMEHKLFLSETDTVFYTYNEKDNIEYEITKRIYVHRKNDEQQPPFYRFTKNTFKNDSVLISKTYNCDKLFKSEKLTFENYTVYNKQGLILNRKSIDVDRFLFFKKRRVIANYTFEYYYWE